MLFFAVSTLAAIAMTLARTVLLPRVKVKSVSTLDADAMALAPCLNSNNCGYRVPSLKALKTDPIPLLFSNRVAT